MRLEKSDGNDRRGSDGIHRQGREGLFGQKISSSGEVTDPNDPESILIAKEEEEAAEAADKGMTLKQYRDWQKGQRFDKAA